MKTIQKCASTRREFLMISGIGTLGVFASGFTGAVSPRVPPSDMFFYIGTYTSGKSEGIYLYRLNAGTGELTHVSTTKGVVDPSYLALDHRGRFLFAVNEVTDFRGKKSGAISAFAINQRTGELRFLNQSASAGGAPCYLSVNRQGKFVLVANYVGGNVSVLPVRPQGTLGEVVDLEQHNGSSVNHERQEGPHAHCIVLDTTEEHAYSCDLGTDRVMIYDFNAETGKLTPGKEPWVQTSPGAGPRHITFHPDGRRAYVINELDATVSVFEQDKKTGALKEIQNLRTLPADFKGANTSADIHIAPNGRFLYCSNRGHDSIAAFEIDKGKGKLSFIQHEPTQGKNPRNFVIDPTGAFMLVANQGSDNIVSFRLDRTTGKLLPTGHIANVPTPVCLKFQTLSR